jgi:hypothetical protein
MVAAFPRDGSAKWGERHITSITIGPLARKRLTRDETRDRIMTKADGRGYRRRVEHVAGNIYKFFSSKEAIIQATADRNLVVLTEAVHRRMFASGALDRIEKVLLTIYRHTAHILRNERQVFIITSRGG